jgi:hypothetical protein
MIKPTDNNLTFGLPGSPKYPPRPEYSTARRLTRIIGVSHHQHDNQPERSFLLLDGDITVIFLRHLPDIHKPESMPNVI